MTTLTFFLETLLIMLVYFFLNRRIKVLEEQHQIEDQAKQSLIEYLDRIKDKFS